ncbi:MAG: aspartyl protease family protein [Saprospiraceae bacterium]|nr:aspartyl protease family protein [Saprospiraceae bacterium]
MNIRLKNYIILFVFLVTAHPIYAQYSGLDLLGAKSKKEIPFKYVNGFLIVKVFYANFFELNFLFDTGASHNILFKKNVNDILGITYTDTILIGGADIHSKMKALVCRNIPMQLKDTDVILRDIIVLEQDFLDLEKVLGTRVDGILGGDFFKGLVVGIDHKKDKITIYNPNRFTPNRKKFTEHAIDIHNYKPYLKSYTQIEGKGDTLNYLLDSGASLALLIHANNDSNFQMPENVIIGNLGKGLGGDISGYVGLIDGLKIDQYAMSNIITSFQEIDSSFLESEQIIRDGIIGNVILSRFHIIIDYMREKLYLKSISKLEEEFEYDKSGMLIYALGEKLNQYYIKTIFPDTPAEEAGLLPGDKILKIGFWPSKFYSLSGMLGKLQAKEGKKIKITVERNGEKLKTQFRLRDPFKHKKNKKGTNNTIEAPK